MTEIMHCIVSVGVGLAKSAILHCLAAAKHKMDPAKPKKANFSFRLDHDLRRRLDEACKATDEEDTGAVVRACIQAYVETVERDGEITKPFAIVAKSRLRKLENPAEESSAKTGQSSPLEELLCPPESKLRPQPAPAGAVHMPRASGSSTAESAHEGLIAEDPPTPGAPSSPPHELRSVRPVKYSRGKHAKPKAS